MDSVEPAGVRWGWTRSWLHGSGVETKLQSLDTEAQSPSPRAVFVFVVVLLIFWGG